MTEQNTEISAKMHRNTMFESTRLLFRELNETDFNFFYELLSDIKVMKYAYSDRFTCREDALTNLRKRLQSQNDKDQGTLFVAIHRESGKMIAIVDYDVHIKNSYGGIFEIGYFLKPEYWGVGYGLEMAHALTDFLFSTFNIHKVIASCNEANQSSERIMQKLGMTKEAVFRKVRYKNNQWVDEIKYGLLKEEWISG